ncbi:NHL domain-containing protein [Streptomyces sp. NPDC001667]
MRGYSGDGGPAFNAQLNDPRKIACGPDGDFFITDLFGYRVRKVTSEGEISTVAGTGVPGSAGDGGFAVNAQLNAPESVALGRDGSIYVSEWSGHRVRRIAPDGMISTYAGTGVEGFSGDGGYARTAQLRGPSGLAVDQEGNLYVCDTLNYRVRKVTPEGGISTLAGTGVPGAGGDGGPAATAQLDMPLGVTVNRNGEVFIADQGNHKVRKVDARGMISTVAGTGMPGYRGDGGPAATAQLYYPRDVALSASENELYIADTLNSCVRVVRGLRQPVAAPVIEEPGEGETVPGPRPAVRGTGTPGATVTVGFGGSGVPGMTVPVGPDGQWSAIPGQDLPPGPVTVTAFQSSGSSTSPAVSRTFTVTSLPQPAVAQADGVIPLPLAGGVTVSSAFTVSADTAVPAGQPATVTFPAGLSLPADGQVRYICPADGTNTALFTNTTGTALSSVTFPAQEITRSTACFYSANVQATGNPTGPPQGTISVAGTTHPTTITIS